MLWGKTLKDIAMRATELLAQAKEQYGDTAHVNVMLAWFGNELVGETGIAQNPNWPFDGPNGHWPDVLESTMFWMRWFNLQCKELGPAEFPYIAAAGYTDDFEFRDNEEVRRQQPATTEFHDPKNLDPKMFPAAPAAPASSATGSGVPEPPPPPAPKAAEPATISVTTERVHLTANPSATGAASSSKPEQPVREAQQPASSPRSMPPDVPKRLVRSYYMEDHVQEYSYTMVVNDQAKEVPAVLVNGVPYELEVRTFRDFEDIDILRTRRCDKRFSEYATRINKVTRGHASCENIRMDHDLVHRL
eukprot:s977_g5.t1